MAWNFLQNRTFPIGIEVGATGVRMLQLRLGRAGWHVIAAASHEYDQPLPEDNITERTRIVSDAVRLAKSQASFEGTDCISCLSTSDMMFRATRLPKMEDSELDKAAAWEAADRFNMELDELQTIWIRAGEVSQGSEARDEVILVSVPKKLICAHLDALIENRLRPIAVDTSFAAVTRSTCRTLRRRSDLTTVQMIIDIGTKMSSVILTRGNQFAFLKTIPVGGCLLNRSVAKALKMTDSEATEIRRRRIQPTEDNEGTCDRRVDRAIFEAVRPHLHDLAQEAALCLRYYSVTFRGARPKGIKITGMDAAEPNLATVIAEHLKLQTEIAKPFEGIDISRTSLGSDRRASSHADWTTVLGLTLRGQDGTLIGKRSRRPDQFTIENDERRDAA